MTRFKLNLTLFFAFQLFSLQAFALVVGDSIQFYGAKGLVVAVGDPLSDGFVEVKFDIFEAPLVAPSSFFDAQRDASFDDGYIGKRIVEASLEKFLGSKKLGPFMMTSFKGYLIPIQVTRGAVGVDIFIDSTGHRPTLSCLALRVELPEKKAHIARILSQLGDAPVQCPLPIVRRGTLLLELVDALSEALRLEKVTLVDFSKRRCEVNKRDTSLDLLRIIQKGAGWYESHGYLTDNHEDYRQRVKDYLNYPIQTLEEEVDLWGTVYPTDMKSHLESHPPDQRSAGDLERYVDDFSAHAELLSSSLRVYRRYLKLFENNRHSDSVSEFLSWLWDTDCATYTVLVDEFLEEPSSQRFFKFPNLRVLSKLLTKVKGSQKR